MLKTPVITRERGSKTYDWQELGRYKICCCDDKLCEGLL